jgi:peptide chain release factor 1
MKPFLRTKLETIQERLLDLESLLAKPDLMADMKAYQALSQEHRQVTPAAGRFQRYLQIEADIAAAREMLQDADMAEMAREEITSGEAELIKLEDELQRLLIPRDPDDARAAFVEIRAGTGGDESALFAGDLCRMYTRFATAQGWRVEVMSESPSEVGCALRAVWMNGALACMASCGLNRVATACNVCRPPRRKAASTPAPAQWP